MSWEAPLRALIASGYGDVTGLDSIAHYRFDDRVVARATFAGRPAATVRAFTGDVRDWLLAQAAVLDRLEALAFPAPRVVRTRSGGALASDGAWTALLLTYVEGEEAGHAPEMLEAIGRHAAELHRLPAGELPPSRLAPAPALLALLPELERGADAVPEVARALHRSAVETLRGLAGWARLPTGLLHGDCWPANAIRTPEGRVVMVDWEGAGYGPAFMELGYLLMGVHAGGPQLPAMRADPERIAAVVRGYAAVRRPSAAELALLPQAVRFHVVQLAVQNGSFAEPAGRWHEDLWLRKSLAREAVSDEIAAIAADRFEKA